MNISLKILTVIMLIFAGACSEEAKKADIESESKIQADSPSSNTEKEDEIKSDKVTLQVKGMSCPLCATNISKKVLELDGVEKLSSDLKTGQVLVHLSADNKPSREDFRKAVTDAGFTLASVTEVE